MKSGNDNIFWGMLNKLVKERKIQKRAQNPSKPDRLDGWELTEKEFDRRGEDVELG